MSETPPSRPREDPWEARERMLRRYREGGSGSSRRSSRRNGSATEDEFGGPATPEDKGLRNNRNAIGLVVGIFLLLLAEVPTLDPQYLKIFSQAGTTLLLLLLSALGRFPERFSGFLRRAPNIPVLLLVAWSGFEFFHAPYRTYAGTEVLRVLGGAAAYLLAAYGLRTPRQLAYAVSGLIGLTVLISFYDISRNGQTGSHERQLLLGHYSILGTHETVSALLVLLFPLTLVLALSPIIEEKRRLAATAASIVLGAALLIARSRGAWFAGLLGLIVLVALLFVSSASQGSQRRGGKGVTAPGVLLAGGMFIFVLIGGVLPLLRERATTLNALGEDTSFLWRLEVWASAARMAWEHPLTGWGLGSYSLFQGQWTHQGLDTLVAFQQPVGYLNNAHNYYAQWAVDAGGVGVFLYVAALASFLISAVRALAQRAKGRFGQLVLIGCVAAITGAAINAVASPAYYMPGVYSLFWAIMGLGVTGLRLAYTPPDSTEEEHRPLLWGIWGGAIGSALLAVAAIGGIAARTQALGQKKPYGQLHLTVQAPRRVTIGSAVRIVAWFTDENGHDRPTMPGTLWSFPNFPEPQTRWATLSEQAKDVLSNRHSVVLFNAPAVPASAGPLRVQAQYQDRFGRWYRATALVTVQPNIRTPGARPADR